MKAGRIVRRVVIAMALGAATTVGVAWGFALRGVPVGMLPEKSRPLWYLAADSNRLWSLSGPQEHFGVTRLDAIGSRGFQRGIDREPDNTASLQPRTTHSQGRHLRGSKASVHYELHLGWPLRALWSSAEDMPAKRAGMIVLRDAPAYRVPYGRRRDERTSHPLALPVGVLPMGFALDTALYACVWLAVFTLARRGLRCRHAARGLCPQCRYDRAGIPAASACPECGAAAPRRASAGAARSEPISSPSQA